MHVAPTLSTAAVARTRSRNGASRSASRSTSVSRRSRKREALLARVHGLYRRAVLLQEAEDLTALEHDADVASQDRVPGLVAARLVLGPVQEGVELGEVIVGEAVDDIFLRLEV
jgi:hypothetical protein